MSKMYSRMASIACLMSLVAVGGCSTGKSVEDDVQARPTSMRLVAQPVVVMPSQQECAMPARADRRLATGATGRMLENAPATLAPGDSIRVDVADGEEFSGQHTVNIDGRINLAYIGAIKASGRSVRDLTSAIETALIKGGYFPKVNARVSVSPISWAPIQVAVSGAVFEPGRGHINEFNAEKVQPIVFQTLGDGSRLRFIDAGIRSAAGVRPDADLTQVQLTRNGKIYTVDLSGVVTGGAMPDIPLMNGDQVHVPSSGCFEEALMRPSMVTPAGIRVFMSNLTTPASSNNLSAIGKYASELPYGSRLMDAAIAANCVGGTESTNAGRSIVFISANPMTRREEVIERDIDRLMAGVNDRLINPYLMPNDAVACYDSTVTNIREVARTISDIVSPFRLTRDTF